MSFVFNGNRDDKEQVRPYLEQYAGLRAAGLSYNDDFVGRMDGVAGSEHESKAIYMLSCLWRIENERAEIAAALADGYRMVESGRPNARQRYSEVILYRPGHYVGGTGLLTRHSDVRLAHDAEGKPFALIPRGKRNGFDARGAEVLAK